MKQEIYMKDCIQDLQHIPMVDYTITDPPYPNGRDLFVDDYFDAYVMLYYACKITKEKVIFFWSNIGIPQPPIGWYEIARHIWHKPNGQSATYYENVIVWGKINQQSTSKVWRIPIINYETLPEYENHPTQKPIRLMRAIVSCMTKENDLILDPFAGTGTTLLACKQLHRRGVGYEKNPDYYTIADKRLKQTTVKGFFETLTPSN